jgi:hypothetical protein
MVCKYTVQQCIVIYDSYARSDSSCVCHREFQQTFSGANIPADLVLPKKVKRGCHVLTEEKLHDVDARLEHFPGKYWQNKPSKLGVLVS